MEVEVSKEEKHETYYYYNFMMYIAKLNQSTGMKESCAQPIIP